MLCDHLEGWDGKEVAGRFKKGTCVDLWPVHVVRQKPTKQCKAIILQLEKNISSVVTNSIKTLKNQSYGKTPVNFLASSIHASPRYFLSNACLLFKFPLAQPPGSLGPGTELLNRVGSFKDSASLGLPLYHCRNTHENRPPPGSCSWFVSLNCFPPAFSGLAPELDLLSICR